MSVPPTAKGEVSLIHRLGLPSVITMTRGLGPGPNKLSWLFALTRASSQFVYWVGLLEMVNPLTVPCRPARVSVLTGVGPR